MVHRMPQVPPVLQDEAVAELEKETALPPFSREAKAEIFLRTWVLPHSGQVISWVELEERTSSSKLSWHSLHSNSKIGMTGFTL